MLYKIKEVDKNLCNACEKCVKICHANCFDMTEIDNKIVAEFKNKDLCDACGDCIAICPVKTSAIVLMPVDKNKHGFVKGINSQKCQACGKCLDLCPGKNIEITEENGKIFAKIIDPQKCIADGHCSFCCNVDDKIYSQNNNI